jgi:hypothetical protein
MGAEEGKRAWTPIAATKRMIAAMRVMERFIRHP